jgi:hypothetical protein
MEPAVVVATQLLEVVVQGLVVAVVVAVRSLPMGWAPRLGQGPRAVAGEEAATIIVLAQGTDPILGVQEVCLVVVVVLAVVRAPSPSHQHHMQRQGVMVALVQAVEGQVCVFLILLLLLVVISFRPFPYRGRRRRFRPVKAEPVWYIFNGRRGTEMKYAILDGTRIRDIAPGDPNELYHPSVAVLYNTQVPDEAAPGDFWDGLQLIKQVVPSTPVDLPPPPVVYPQVSPVQFKLLFTSPERIAIKAARATDPVVDDFFDIVEDPRLTHVDLGLQSTQDALSYLVSVNLLTTERRAEILLGQVQ